MRYARPLPPKDRRNASAAFVRCFTRELGSGPSSSLEIDLLLLHDQTESIPRETATHTVQQLLLKVDAHARLRLVMNDTQIVPTVLGIASVVPKHLLEIRPRSRLKPRAVTDTHQAVLNGIVTVSRNSSRRCARKGPGR